MKRLIPVVGGLLAFGLALGLFLWLPGVLVDNSGGRRLQGKDLVSALTEERRTVLAALAAIGAALTLWYTHQRQRLDRDSNRTDRYTKAVEQLGDSSKPAVQLGGIYALERVALDSVRDRSVAFDVISAFVRQQARAPRPDEEEPDRLDEPSRAAIRVLARNKQFAVMNLQEVTWNDVDLVGEPLAGARLGGARLVGSYLYSVDLREAELISADLTNANLMGATLLDADLTQATLHEADLARADLRRADLTRADLSGAKLDDAKLFRATLSAADLSDAKLPSADLRRADLTRADLGRAQLNDADLSGANLSDVAGADANLTNANLAGANLTDADLTGANLTRANLTGADLTGADLTDAELTDANLTNAIGLPSAAAPKS